MQFLQLLEHGITRGTQGVELFRVFRASLSAQLLALGSQLVNLRIPLLDLRIHLREVLVFLAHDLTPFAWRHCDALAHTPYDRDRADPDKSKPRATRPQTGRAPTSVLMAARPVVLDDRPDNWVKPRAPQSCA